MLPRRPLQGLHENVKNEKLFPTKLNATCTASGQNKQVRMAHVRSLMIADEKENSAKKVLPGQQDKPVSFNLRFVKKENVPDSTGLIANDGKMFKRPAVRANSCDAKLLSMSHSLQPCIDTTRIKTYRKPVDQQKVRLPERAPSRRRHHSDGSAKRRTSKTLYESLGGVVLDMSKAKVYKKKPKTTPVNSTENQNGDTSARRNRLNCKGPACQNNRSVMNRSVPRNPSYLAAIEEALKMRELATPHSHTRSKLSMVVNGVCSDAHKNGGVVKNLTHSRVNPHFGVRDACTTTEDLQCNSNKSNNSTAYFPRTSEKSWKRLNILHLFGSDCDQDLSSLCQMAKDGTLNGRYCEMTTSQTASPELRNNSSSSSGIGSMCCDSMCKPVLHFRTNQSRSEDPQNSTFSVLCERCQSPLAPCRESSTLANSLNDSVIPNYIEQNSSEVNCTFDSHYLNPGTNASFDDRDSQSSVCTASEKYDKFAESYKQNLMVVCKTCEAQLPLPHRLSLKLNCGIAVEFSHGNSHKNIAKRLSLMPLGNGEQPFNFVNGNSIDPIRLSCGSCSNAITNLNEAFIELYDEQLFSGKQIRKNGNTTIDKRFGNMSLNSERVQKSSDITNSPNSYVNGAITKSIQNHMFHRVSESIQVVVPENEIVNPERANAELADCLSEPMESVGNHTADSTNDFSQICVVNRQPGNDSDENSTLCSSQFWQDSSSDTSSSSDSDEWNYTDDGQSDTDNNSSKKHDSSQDIPDCSALSVSLNEGSRHWSLEALPSRSFVEKDPDCLVYKGYYSDVMGKGVVDNVELSPVGNVSSRKNKIFAKPHYRKSWSYSDLTFTPKPESKPKCLCNCCMDLSTIKWPSSLTEQESDSEIKAAFSNPVYETVPNESPKDCEMEDEYATLRKDRQTLPVCHRHSTPQKAKSTQPEQVKGVEGEAESEDLNIYFWNVKVMDDGQPTVVETVPALTRVNEKIEKTNNQVDSCSEKQYGFTPKSLQCSCWCVHRDWEQARHNPDTCAKPVSCRLFHNSEVPLTRQDFPIMNHLLQEYKCVPNEFCSEAEHHSAAPGTPKYKAKDVIANKAQLKLAVYVNAGLLTVHVMSAKKVYSRFLSFCNPYVKVSLFPHHPSHAPCRTNVVEGSQNPTFDEKFSFELTPHDFEKRLLVSLWHRDVCVERSEFLGCMSFGIKHIFTKTQVSGWYRVLTEAVGRSKHFAVRPSSDRGDPFD